MAKKNAPAAAQEDVATDEQKSAGETVPAKKGQKKATGYEEWRCEIKLSGSGNEVQKQVEKVKRLRENVKITDEEAETLNRGAKDSPRQDFVIMYFKPE
jgi:hypothetical protein